MDKWIAVFDIKAFYASFECVERGLDPFTTPLAVTDTSRKESTIVLSVSPFLKSLGVPSRCRRKELPKDIKGLILATPQMEKYIKESAKVVSIFLDFVGEDDIHVYSIDEAFLNLGPYLELYKMSAFELCKKIQKTVYEKTKLTLTCGLSHNMFLAKVADDREAKTNKDFIALWEEKDIEEKLWKIKPLSKLWGISTGYERSLNMMGIYSVYDLAHYSKDLLIKKFGIMGEELYNNANGIDDTDIREKYVPKEKNLSLGQVLMRDYTVKEIPLIIKEMCDDLSSRLRKFNYKTSTVALYLRYSLNVDEEGFSHQVKLMRPTDISEELFTSLIHLFEAYSIDKPIRAIHISFSNLSRPETRQLLLFDDDDKNIKEASFDKSYDDVHKVFGSNSLTRTSALKKESTAKIRHNQIGGHRK